MNLEQDLRRAFGRKPAPPGFAERVLARLEQRDVRPAPAMAKPPRLAPVRRLAAAAAIALAAIGGAQYYTHQRTIAEAERVQREVGLALQIVSEKLALVQDKLQEPQR